MDKAFALSLPTANDFNAYVNTALKNGEISKEDWYALNNSYFTKRYLAADNPRAQSGHGGDEYHYAFKHLPLIEAVYRNGTFLDVGCANGHLCEMVHKWATVIGFDLQVYGVDISEGLIALAHTRLPQWRENFVVSNSFNWRPEQKFDYIHVGGLGQVPEEDELLFFEHLMEHYVADGGRMFIGPYWNDEAIDSRCTSVKKLLATGITPSGYLEKTHYSNPHMILKLLWFDKK
jgi:SAM-dependent methyltransferase